MSQSLGRAGGSAGACVRRVGNEIVTLHAIAPRCAGAPRKTRAGLFHLFLSGARWQERWGSYRASQPPHSNASSAEHSMIAGCVSHTVQSTFILAARLVVKGKPTRRVVARAFAFALVGTYAAVVSEEWQRASSCRRRQVAGAIEDL